MFAMPLAAQAASYTYINQRAPYSNPSQPMLTALNLPKVGTTFKVQVPNYWEPIRTSSGRLIFAGAYHYLAFGVSNPNLPISALGGFLFTSADLVVPAPRNSRQFLGTVTMAFPIPNSPQLVGVRFYQQVLTVCYTDLPMSVCGYSLSRGGVGIVGK